VTARLLALLAVTAFAAPAASASAGSCCAKDFKYTGREQTFVVPAGVYIVTVFATGAGGGVTEGVQANGDAAYADATLNVRPGERLYVEVGGAGTNAVDAKPCPGISNCLEAPGGFNGGGASIAEGGVHPGGGGGGASDVQTKPMSAGSAALFSRLVVAAGAGGSGGDGSVTDTYGGRGGASKQDGRDGFSRHVENDLLGGGGGEGGTVAIDEKGAGGRAGASSSPNPAVYFPGTPGEPGMPGAGGAGGDSVRLLPGVGQPAKSVSGAGGGGGGGYVGGGGGGSGGIYECGPTQPRCKTSFSPDVGGGGGGGGGSSFSPEGKVNVSDNEPPPSNGSITIDWR
jgi:hypothetical protein